MNLTERCLLHSMRLWSILIAYYDLVQCRLHYFSMDILINSNYFRNYNMFWNEYQWSWQRVIFCIKCDYEVYRLNISIWINVDLTILECTFWLSRIILETKIFYETKINDLDRALSSAFNGILKYIDRIFRFGAMSTSLL